MKKKIEDLAIFGGSKTFQSVKSTSNLVQPNPETFFSFMEESFKARQLTNNGPIVQKLERRLAEIHETKFCIAVCNGFWAIAMCMKILAIQGKKEVIMPSLTYRRMADIAAWVNLTPHFCEVDKNGLAMDANSVEKCINGDTALIMGVHPIVNLCNIDALLNVAKRHNVPILFDSVEASFSSYKGKMVGSFAEAECFSAHASKFLNGFEGGYITTNNQDLAKQLQIMRGFGFCERDKVQNFGINAKLNEIHAAMMLASIEDSRGQIKRNYELYSFYRDNLGSVKGVELLKYSEEEKRTYKNIVIKLNEDWPLTRECTIKIMHEENMLVRPYYSPPLHLKSCKYDIVSEDLSLTENLAQEYLLLPCGSFVTTKDAKQVISLLSFLQENGKKIIEILKNDENKH